MFWETFWPQLWATIAGIALGLPVALWLDRRAKQTTSKAARERTIEELRLVHGTIELNNLALQELLEKVAKAPVEFAPAPHLAVDVWDAVRDHITLSGSDRDLVVHLTDYFEWIAHFVRDYDRLLDVTIGSAAALHGSVMVRQVLFNRLIEDCHSLHQVGSGLNEDLEKLIGTHPPAAEA